MKARFISEPASALAEYGMEVPDGVNMKVVENIDDTVHITFPVKPNDYDELSDNELADA